MNQDKNETEQGQKCSYQTLWRRLLPRYDEAEAKAIVRLVLDEGFGLTMADICCGKVEELPAAEQERLQNIMTRLGQGEPVQYVLGRADFCGRPFHVGPGVLIPRPETEALCRKIVSDHNRPYCALQPPVPLQVLDVGTGSGCIAVTLALDLYHAAVTAWDVSPDALLTARDNAHRLGAKVNLEWQDALQPPADTARWDIIVSNPPYIAEQERREMSPHVVGHEPSLALFVPDDDPLRFYRAIASYARNALRTGGTLYFEINPRYATELQTLLGQLGFGHVQLLDDDFGKQRFCTAGR